MDSVATPERAAGPLGCRGTPPATRAGRCRDGLRAATDSRLAADPETIGTIEHCHLEGRPSPSPIGASG